MGKWFPRRSKESGFRVDLGEPVNDVFQQPERSLLGEAIMRPSGLAASVVLIVSTGAFLANHFVFRMDRINDFALVAFFVGGGILLSSLLRSGDPNVDTGKRTRRAVRPAQDDELVLDHSFDTERPRASAARTRTVQAAGLAEAPAASSPVPPEALVKADAIMPVTDEADDEVGSFQQALVHYVNEGDFHGQGEVLRRLGHLAKSRGHLKESREFYMNARNCFRKIDDHYAEAAVLLDLGQVLESLEEHDAASAAYRDANRALLDVAMNSGDSYSAVQAQAAD